MMAQKEKKITRVDKKRKEATTLDDKIDSREEDIDRNNLQTGSGGYVFYLCLYE